MPDPGKFKKLHDVGYTVNKGCALCDHGDFQNKGSMWGYCNKHSYQHGKHTDPAHKLGVLMLGVCNDFEYDLQAVASSVQSYGEFLEEE